MERTLAIVKPDAVARKLTGDILKRIEAGGLRIVALKLMHLTRAQARVVLRGAQGAALLSPRFATTCRRVRW